MILKPLKWLVRMMYTLPILMVSMLGLASSARAEVQGVTDSEIVLGSHLDLSGPAASLGTAFRDGLIFASEEVNAGGGIHGRKIRLIVEDSNYDPKKAILATQKLLSQDKVFAVMLTLGAAHSTASMPLVLERGIPFLFPASTAESTYAPFHPLKFAFTTPAGDQARAAVKYAYEKLGKRRFGILYQDDDTGLSALKAVEDQMKVHGIALIERTSFKRGEIDFSSQIGRMKSANVDVVMIAANVRETASAEIEAKKQSWSVDMIGNQGASTNATIKLGGPAVDGLYVTTQFMSATQEMTPALSSIMDRYKARFGRNMEDGVGYAYTAMMLFAEGARNAGKNLTPQTLSAGLEKVKNFKTVFEAPSISYAPHDHSPPKATIIIQVKNGKFAQVTGPITY